MHLGRRGALVLARQKPGGSATLVKMISKGDEITDGLSHADQREQIENRHQWVRIFILHQSFPQWREKVPVEELTRNFQPFKPRVGTGEAISCI